MAEFTKEQLIDHIRDMMESSKEMIDGNGVPVEFIVRAERDIAVYEIALAALTDGMEQGPVAWRWFHLKQWHVTNDEARARNLAWDGVNVTPLYEAPQLPQPVEPEITSEELDNELLEQLIDFRRDTLSYHKKEGNKVQTVMHGVVLRAMLELQELRSAMLHGAEPVRPRDELPVIGWVRADYQNENRNGDAPLFVFGAKDPSSAWGVPYMPVGNSTAIPDGWVGVPVEPTKEMVSAGQDEMDNCIENGFDSDIDGNRFDYTEISPDAPYRIYLAMIAAAPQQEVK